MTPEEKSNDVREIVWEMSRVTNKILILGVCDLVDRFGLIAFEDLNIKNMIHNHNLAKSIGDVAWNMLVNITSYKAASAGSMVVLVDPKNTSKMCSRCGILVDKSLSDRVRNCQQYGLSIDRDWDAAINILRLGMVS